MKIVAAVTLAALVAALVMPRPVLADGAASTRNILLGAAAATLLIINHNKKVHQRYAEDAQRQAELASQANDAKAEAAQYQRAYQNEVAVADNLKREVSVQHDQIASLQQQVALLNGRQSQPFTTPTVANVQQTSGNTHQVSVVSYGWGAL